MKMTQHSSPGFSFSGFAAYGGSQPGQLGRVSHAPGSQTTRSMGPCFCLCGGAPEAQEMTSAAPCFCLCTPVHEAEEMNAAVPGFCLCNPALEADA